MRLPLLMIVVACTRGLPGMWGGPRATDAWLPGSTIRLQCYLRLHSRLLVWPSLVQPLMKHLQKQVGGKQPPCMQIP